MGFRNLIKGTGKKVTSSIDMDDFATGGSGMKYQKKGGSLGSDMARNLSGSIPSNKAVKMPTFKNK